MAGGGDQVGQNLLAQRGEKRWITKELGHFDQEAADEAIVLVGMAQQIAAVRRQRVRLGRHHSPMQTPLQSGRLVVAEVEAAARIKMLKQRLQSLGLTR